MRRVNSQRIASIGILSALSLVILFAIPTIKLFPAVPFLELDFADIPIFIATFLYGPLTGLAITITICVIQGITISAVSGIMGILMHFVATGSFVIVSGLIYKRFHTFKGAIVSLIAGIFAWNIVMIPFNLLITPIFLNLFFNTPKEAIYDYLVPFIIPFNLIKSSLNALITLLLYKSIHKLFNRIMPQHKSPSFVETPKTQLTDSNSTDNKLKENNISDTPQENNNAANNLHNEPKI